MIVYHFIMLPECYDYPSELLYPALTPAQLTPQFKSKLNDLGLYHPAATDCPCTPPNNTDPLECQTPPFYEPPLPPAPVSRCVACVDANVDHCDEAHPTQPCQCKSGWEGQNCNEPTQCHAETEEKCGTRGFLPTTTQTSPNGLVSEICDVAKTHCTCYNSFIGSSCELCGLDCNGHGKPYKACDRCGCDEGWTGAQCNCRGEIGYVTINLYNESVRITRGRLSPTNTKPESITVEHTTPGFKSDILEPNGYGLWLLGKQIYPQLVQHLTNAADGKYKFEMTPLDTNEYHTHFKFEITYGCDEANPQINNLDQLEELWNDFVLGFVNFDVIKNNFSLHIDPKVIDHSLEPIAATLPAPGEEFTPIIVTEPKRNGVALPQSLNIIVIFTMVVVTIIFSSTTMMTIVG